MIELVAHRAGNAVDILARAERVADTIEIDVHAGPGGAIEVRHAKVLWPTRRLWERWYLLPRETSVGSLGAIVEAAAADTHLWLDLKGVMPSVADRARIAVAGRERVTASSKSWWLLRRFAGVPGARTFRSAGNRFELALLSWLPTRVRTDGAVVHRRLLTPAVIARLRQRGLLFTWAVDDLDTIRRLAAAGVDGVIVDELALIEAARAALGERPASD